jgi:NADH-quinone oxidoreductase subunit E
MKQGSSPDLTAAKEILGRYRERSGSLIEVLQEIHDAYGYIPKETVELTAETLGCSTAHIYGVLTFYTQFYLTPRGKHILRVCQGTACHVMGGKQVFEYLSQRLAIKDGETTRDNQFSLEQVACVGACGMAPVVVVDEDSFGNVSVQGTEDIISRYADHKNEERGPTGEK